MSLPGRRERFLSSPSPWISRTERKNPRNRPQTGVQKSAGGPNNLKGSMMQRIAVVEIIRVVGGAGGAETH